MKARHHLTNLSQADIAWANIHWHEFDGVLVVSDAGAASPILCRSVGHEDTPTVEDIEAWITYAIGYLSQDKKVLVVCDDGDHRSSTVCALIQSVHTHRPFSDIVDQYHREFLLESPSHNWFPYTKWGDAIHQYLANHYPTLVNNPGKEKPPLVGRFPPTLMNYQFTTFAQLLTDMLTDNRWGRPDQLASLYAYVRSLPPQSLVVEIGTDSGISAVVMAHALKGTGGHLITIDPAFQKGGAQVVDDDDLPSKAHSLDVNGFLETISAQGLDGYISIVPDYSENVLKRWDGRQIGLVYIDGAHTYQEVKKDCDWLTYIQPGGLAAFDDWLAGVEQAVQEYIADKPEWRMVYESTTQAHDHYFVTLLEKGTHGDSL